MLKITYKWQITLTCSNVIQEPGSMWIRNGINQGDLDHGSYFKWENFSFGFCWGKGQDAKAPPHHHTKIFYSHPFQSSAHYWSLCLHNTGTLCICKGMQCDFYVLSYIQLLLISLFLLMPLNVKDHERMPENGDGLDELYLNWILIQICWKFHSGYSLGPRWFIPPY